MGLFTIGEETVNVIAWLVEHPKTFVIILLFLFLNFLPGLR